MRVRVHMIYLPGGEPWEAPASALVDFENGCLVVRSSEGLLAAFAPGEWLMYESEWREESVRPVVRKEYARL